MGITREDEYRYDLSFLTNYLLEMSDSVDSICAAGDVANVPGEIQMDLMGVIDTLIASPHCSLQETSRSALLSLRRELEMLPKPLVDYREITVQHCIAVISSEHWQAVREACRHLLPQMKNECLIAGVKQ